MADTAIAEMSGMPSASGPRQDAPRRLRVALRSLAILGALLEFWVTRYAMSPDGLSYVDIAGLYAHGAWKSAVSDYWSPMFSWLLAAMLAIVRPSARLESTFCHVVCLAGYLCALLAFEYFLQQLEDAFNLKKSRRCWLISAYAAFIWTSLPLIGSCTPDVFVTALVYLFAAMLLRSTLREPKLAFCAGFGALIGVGWLTKAALLPIGLATLPLFAVAIHKRRNSWSPILCTFGALVLTCAPFLVTLRAITGEWTFGKSGPLNYAWEVNGVTRFFHWQGGREGAGLPLHPTRQISTSPAAYEFSTSWPATYAPWFDPVYWYQGIRVHFHPGLQLSAFAINFSLSILLLAFVPGIVPAILLAILARDHLLIRSWFRISSGAWIFCGVSILLYSLVFVEPRYICGMLCVASCLLMALVLSSHRPLNAKADGWFASAAVIACLYVSWRPVVFGSLIVLLNLAGMQPYGNDEWREAQYMQKIGMQPGDSIAIIGEACMAYWPRLDRVRVVAEVPVRYEKELKLVHPSYPVLTNLYTFWNAPPERQRDLLATFARLGIRWVVAEPVPPGITPGDGWIKLPFAKKGEKEFNYQARTFVQRISP